MPHAKTQRRKDLRWPKVPAYALIIIVPLILVAGCGKKATPISPDAVLPGPPREFRVSQEGESLVVSWLFPKEDRLGRPLTQLQGFRLQRGEVRGVAPQPIGPEFTLLADIDLAYPREGQVKGEAVVYQDQALVPGRRYWYRVAAYDQERYLGGWSPVLTRAWDYLPRPPRDLKALAGDKAVALAWSPVTHLQDGSPIRDLAGYVIYRRSGDGAWLKVTPQPVGPTTFQDVAVLNDVEYDYQVHAARQVGGDLLESVASPMATALPEDRTPPPPLLNLVAVATSEGIGLHWDPSPATDLAGYRVYRRGPGEATFEKLTPQLLTRPYFVDTRAARGKAYTYYVTAVDNSRRANESLPSEEAGTSF
ncbi:MAG: hypothetical protein FJ134_12315 [Deltaproteobacteria bacterium]|nr:hypothetical protein [Deltaproteobacteria bacterium]